MARRRSTITRFSRNSASKFVQSPPLTPPPPRGAFGKVKLAVRQVEMDEQPPTHFAIKISNKQALKRKFVNQKVNAYSMLEREVAIMKKIEHPHLVKLHEVIDDPDDEKIYMVMEYMPKGSIMSTIYWKTELRESDPQRYHEIFTPAAEEASPKKIE